MMYPNDSIETIFSRQIIDFWGSYLGACEVTVLRGLEDPCSDLKLRQDASQSTDLLSPSFAFVIIDIRLLEIVSELRCAMKAFWPKEQN